MGIMNKLKTVALKDFTWIKNGNYFSTINAQPLPNAKFPGQSTAFIGYCSMDYTPIGILPLSAATDKRIAIASNKTLYVRDSRFETVEAFVQYLTDNNITITYETVDSVEEKLISYHAPQLVNGSMNEPAAVVNGQHVIIPKAKASMSQRVNSIHIPVGHKVLNIQRFLRGNAGNKTISFGGYHLGPPNSWQGAQNLPFNTDLRGQTLSVIHAVTDAVTDTWMFVYDPTKTIDEEIECVWTFVDLTSIYGEGNEPASVEIFLSQHPEYNSYVPFYDGQINITEEII